VYHFGDTKPHYSQRQRKAEGAHARPLPSLFAPLPGQGMNTCNDGNHNNGFDKTGSFDPNALVQLIFKSCMPHGGHREFSHRFSSLLVQIKA